MITVHGHDNPPSNGGVAWSTVAALLAILCLNAVTGAADAPEALLQQAAALIQQTIHPAVHTLELWGTDLPTQAQLAPQAQKAVDLLTKAQAAARSRMHDIAQQLEGPNDPKIAKWEAANRMEQGAEYTLHMTQYALALSMDANDPKRGQIISSDTDYLRQFDTPRSGVQVLVRLRLVRLLLLAKQYSQAGELLESITAANSMLTPAPTAAQRQDARRLEVEMALMRNNLKEAAASLQRLPATRPATMAASSSQTADDIDERILRYRLLMAQSHAAANQADKLAGMADAHQLLATVLKEHPEYWPIARRRLIRQAGDKPSIDSLDTLTLQAILQRADIQRQQDHPDHTALEEGLAAARQLLQRHPDDPEVGDQAAILIPVILEKLGQESDAAEAFINYALKPEGKYRDAAFSHAQWLLSHLRQTRGTDPTVKDLYRRFLQVAVLTLDKKQFAFDYASVLQADGQFKQAAHYFALTPASDPHHAQSRLEIIRCLMQVGDLPQAADELAAILRHDPDSPAWALLHPLLDKLDDAYLDALAAQNSSALLDATQARAVLSLLLVDEAKRTSANQLDQVRLYDADCRRQLVELSPPSAQRAAALESIKSVYVSLEHTPQLQAQARLGIALIDYAEGKWQSCADALRSLIESGALGPAIFTQAASTHPSQAADNPAYWEARYKLLKARWFLAQNDPSLGQTVRRDLRVLQAKWGDGIGGRCYHLQFKALDKDMSR